MKTLDVTKLDGKKVEKLLPMLQHLLADYQIYYANLRGFHWNIKGHGFFTLHAKFEEMYDDAADKVDEIAERILMLGGTPANKFSDYLKTAEIKEVSGIDRMDDALKSILDSYGILITHERAILSAASEIGDESTVSLMNDFLVGQEKMVWMITASLS
jgi:starvation-inducible DNA-binding protein